MLVLCIHILNPGYRFLAFFFQAEDGIRDRSPSRGLGDVYKRQDKRRCFSPKTSARASALCCNAMSKSEVPSKVCLLIIFSFCVGAKTVLVRAFAGDEARPFGPVLG